MTATDYETAKDRILQEWNGFGFKFITKEDYPKILSQMYESFYLDEPANKLAGMSPGRKQDLDEFLTMVLDFNHASFFAYPLDNPDKIAAVLIIWFQDKANKIPPSLPPTSEIRSPITKLIDRFFAEFHSRYSVFEMFGVDLYPEIFMVSVDKLFRGKGLALEMYRKAIAKFEAQGLPLVTSEFSNPFSRKIGQRLGFKPVARMEFVELKNSDGSLAFGEACVGEYVEETVLLLK